MKDVPQFPPPAPKYEWATYIEGRRPKYKYHKNRGQAKNAVLYTLYTLPRGGVIYHLEDGEWVVNFTYEPDFTCVVCGLDIKLKGKASVVNYRAKPEDRKVAHWECKYGK